MSKQKLNIEDTAVVITSALFVGQNGERLKTAAVNRMARVQHSLSCLANVGFSNFLLLDNTLPNGFNVQELIGDLKIELTIVELVAGSYTLPPNEYKINGPSRLETILLNQALPNLRVILQNFKFVLKISAGYEVKNLEEIIAKAKNGIVYRMGNPFRTVVKFCLTSFYILPVHSFIDLCVYFYGQLAMMSNSKPLEYHFYTYISSIPHQAVAISYPLLQADFLSSGRSSADLDYRLKELIFRLLAKLGMYAFQPK
jgi:hypothetical protein